MEIKNYLHLTEAKNWCRDLWPQNIKKHLARGRRDAVFKNNDPDFASYSRWQLSKAVKNHGCSEHPSVGPLRAHHRREAILVPQQVILSLNLLLIVGRKHTHTRIRRGDMNTKWKWKALLRCKSKIYKR